MKKKILLILAVLISIAGFSQSKVYYGFKAGVSSADMRGDAVESLNDVLDFAEDYITTGSRTGFTTGAYF